MRASSLLRLLTFCLLPLVAHGASAGGDHADEVRDELAAGRYWVAVALCEEDVERMPGSPDAWVRMGSTLLAMGNAPSEGGGNPGLLFSDAAAAFMRALELDPGRADVLPLAYEAHLASGDLSAAVAVATNGLGASVLSEGLPSAIWLERAIRAQRLQFMRDVPEDPKARADALRVLEASIERMKDVYPEHGPLHLEHARLLQGVGLQRRAGDVLYRGLISAPRDAELHRRLIDVHVGADVPERLSGLYRELSEARPDEGLVWWYRAWVGTVLGERARKEMLWGRAEESFADAVRHADVAAERAPEHAQGARWVRHRALLGLAFCALGERDHELARARLTELVSSAPELRAEQDGLGRSVVDGIGVLGARYVEAGDYAAGARLMRLTCEALPQEPGWWNNLAYMLRQHATFVQAEEGVEAARVVFAESWDAYLHAVALEPENVRYINDAALIQIYHLRDDLERAQGMLSAAVEYGEAQLAALGSSPDESARYPLALAVGDAYENLGYLYYHVTPDQERALGYYERALATDSGERWTVVNHLAALRGERDPIEEHVLLGSAPEEVASALEIPWEYSFEGARGRSGSEGRPIFVYYRGGALTGLDGEMWLKLLERPGVAEALGDTVPVIADLGRHTSLDRRADGSLITCPRFGAIPCSAHVRAAEEFGRFFAEQHDGAQPGGNEEGYFLFDAAGESVEWNQLFFEQLFSDDERVSAPVALGFETARATPDARRMRIELSAAASSRDERALRLFTAGTTAARRETLEQFLFDGSELRSSRGEVLQALAQEGGEGARALLEACLKQTADAELQALAAAAWSDATDVALLVRAADWGAQPAARAAIQRLRNLAPREASLRSLVLAGM